MANKHFPHLDRTNDYPYLSNVDVFRFQNEFDYSRWNENTRVRVCNVIWNSDYQDVVKFDSDADRDAYFDALSDYQEITLTSKNTRMFPDGSVKLPIPYDVLARYNYLYIDMPIVTSADNPIDYERTDGLKRWYFFINDLQYQAPNTTTVFLTPDVWTNFINDLDVNFMMLERGHAPVAFSDVDKYLENPMENNAYLLAPDYDFGSTTIVGSSRYIPFGNGEKWVCFASTCYPEMLSKAGSIIGTETDSWDRPTYEDVDVRFGRQLKVNGFTFGDGRDFSNVNTPAGNGAANGSMIMNNLNVYAVPASECFDGGTFLADLTNKVPGFMNTIQACFIIDEEMAEFRKLNMTLAGHAIYIVTGKHKNIGDITLSKSDFDFPEKYERFAKLYTFPYSRLELTDNDGREIEVRIEDTCGIGCEFISSVAFPYLNLRVLFTGIGGTGSTSYSWVNLNGQKQAREMYDSDWFKYCFDMNIPTYALYMDGKTAYNLHNYNRAMSNARRNALVGYHTSMRDANTARENALDLAETAQANVNANANTMVANNTNSCNTATANTALTCTTNSTNQSLANQNALVVVTDNSTLADALTGNDNRLMYTSTSTQNETSIATTSNTADTSVVTGAINGAVNGFVSGSTMAPGDIAVAGTLAGVMGLTGAVTAGMTARTAKANAVILTQCQQTLAEWTADTNRNKTTITNDNNWAVTNITNDLGTDQTNNNNACITAQTANNNTCATNNTNNTTNTMKANATRTRNTNSNNATQTRLVSELNAKEILENAQHTAKASLDDARNNAPVPYGNYSGSMAPDYMGTRGIQVKVRKQSDSAIRQAGDMFVRYGYALNQAWDVRDSGLNLMKHFTYWKASDIWLDDRRSTTNLVNNTISEIFLRGVTVWRNPDEIGRVDFYDN